MTMGILSGKLTILRKFSTTLSYGFLPAEVKSLKALNLTGRTLSEWNIHDYLGPPYEAS